MADINLFKIGDWQVQLTPKTALMIAGIICVSLAFFNPKITYRTGFSLYILGIIAIIVAGDFYEKFK